MLATATCLRQPGTASRCVAFIVSRKNKIRHLPSCEPYKRKLKKNEKAPDPEISLADLYSVRALNAELYDGNAQAAPTCQQQPSLTPSTSLQPDHQEHVEKPQLALTSHCTRGSQEEFAHRQVCECFGNCLLLRASCPKAPPKLGPLPRSPAALTNEMAVCKHALTDTLASSSIPRSAQPQLLPTCEETPPSPHQTCVHTAEHCRYHSPSFFPWLKGLF